ncbi:hypothetical protein PS2_002044 [Malus domestica]
MTDVSCSKSIQRRLALYQGVCPIYMEFPEDSETSFSNALTVLKEQGLVKAGEEVALVQSGRQPIWRLQPTHNIQVRKFRCNVDGKLVAFVLYFQLNVVIVSDEIGFHHKTNWQYGE